MYKKKASKSEDLLNEAFNLLCLSNSTITPEDFKAFIFTLNNIVLDSMVREGGCQEDSSEGHFDEKAVVENLDDDEINYQISKDKRFKDLTHKSPVKENRKFYLDDSSQCKVYISKFMEFVDNRKDFVVNLQLQNKEEKRKAEIEKRTLDFKPAINSVSSVMATKHYDTLKQEASQEFTISSHADMILLKSREHKQTVDAMRKVRAEDEMKECSFRPDISVSKNQSLNNSRYYSFRPEEVSAQNSSGLGLNNSGVNSIHEYLFNKGNKVRSPPKNPDDIEYEKYKEECTFKPNSKKSSILVNKA